MVNRLAERGVAHILLILILLAGIAGGVYLVQEGPKIFKPKASELRPSDPETSFKLIREGLSKDEVVVKLYARSDISAANVFSAKINFPKDLLELTSIDVELKVSSISKAPYFLVTEAYAAAKKGEACEHDSDCDSGLFCPGKDAAQRLKIDRDICAKEVVKGSGNTKIGDKCAWDDDCEAPPGETRGYCCTAGSCGVRQYKCTLKNGTIPESGSPQVTPSPTVPSVSSPIDNPRTPRPIDLSWTEQTSVDQANNDGTIVLTAQAQSGVKTNTSQDSLLLATIKFKVKKQEGEAKIEFDNSSRITTAGGVNLPLQTYGLKIMLGLQSGSTSEFSPEPTSETNPIPTSEPTPESTPAPDSLEPTIKVVPSEVKRGQEYLITWAHGSTDLPDTIRLTDELGSEWTISTANCEVREGDVRDNSKSSTNPNGQCKFNGVKEQVLTFQLINSKGEAVGNSATLTIRE